MKVLSDQRCTIGEGPLFSVVFSGILLHEEVFRFNYILALCIIFAAILLNSISPKEKKNKNEG